MLEMYSPIVDDECTVTCKRLGDSHGAQQLLAKNDAPCVGSVRYYRVQVQKIS